LDLLNYFSESQLSSLSIKDETYDKMINHLDEFIKSLSKKDKQTALTSMHEQILSQISRFNHK